MSLYNTTRENGIIDIILYKNILSKLLPCFIGNRGCKLFCRRCISSFFSPEVLEKHKKDVSEK